MTLGRRTALLLGYTVLLAALVGGLAYVVVHFQSQSKAQAQERFAQEAGLTAEFTGSLLSTSASSARATAAKEFGGTTLDAHALTAAAARSGLAYLVVLDAGGRRLAASAGTPPHAAAAGSSQVRHALAGTAWLSNLSQPRSRRIVEWAQPFETPSGRRVEVEGFPVAVLGGFLHSFLAASSAGGNGVSFLLDGSDRILAASSGSAQVGGFPKATGLIGALRTGTAGEYRYNGAQRYFSSASVAGSNWRAVTATTTASLYPALAGSDSWALFVLLAAFAAVAAASVFFFRRALVRGDELQHANDELSAINLTLEERVAERTAAAEEQARELARSNEELEQFSSVASHDLQEPLRKIRMFGDRLQARLGDSLSAEAASDLERMSNAAERMQRLINDLLDFSRVTHRGNAFERVALSEVVAEVVADVEVRITELDAIVDVGELPTIEADRTQMRQLLQNLISNALKFHRPDERPVVRVRSEVVDAQEPRFPGESAAGARCVITVEDNGIGFDEKHAERIFGAFERLHGRSAYDGTGIGLSIARKIAWRHGGHVAAAGVPDGGATFTVTLPLSHAPSRNGGGAG